MTLRRAQIARRAEACADAVVAHAKEHGPFRNVATATEFIAERSARPPVVANRTKRRQCRPTPRLLLSRART
eukprot:6387206-Prymnesium_polylepis.1